MDEARNALTVATAMQLAIGKMPSERMDVRTRMLRSLFYVRVYSTGYTRSCSSYMHVF